MKRSVDVEVSEGGQEGQNRDDVLTGLLAGIAAVAVSAALPAPESSDVVHAVPMGARTLTGQIAHLARTVAR